MSHSSTYVASGRAAQNRGQDESSSPAPAAGMFDLWRLQSPPGNWTLAIAPAVMTWLGSLAFLGQYRPAPITTFFCWRGNPVMGTVTNTLLAFFACGVVPVATEASVWGSPPNILFVLTDDQGWSTLGCYGNQLVPTPHLDRLAASGVRFTDAYVMPQCTPTRASLLTGQHTARNQMWHVIGWYGYPWARLTEPAFVESLSPETFNLAKGLKSAGYATACLGKWHLTDARYGSYVTLNQSSAASFGFDWAPAPPSPQYHQTGDKGVGWLTEQALQFIQDHRQQPWFVYLAHHTVHGPVVAPAEIVERYRAAGAPPTGLHNAVYLAALETLDSSLGRLLQGLEELGEHSETLVVFLSDNGGIYEALDPAPLPSNLTHPAQLQLNRQEFSNAPLRAGKGSHYEGGIRVPCLVRWPGVVPPGSISQVPIHVTDWLPTLLSAAGAAIPAEHKIDGIDLRSVLEGKPGPHAALALEADSLHHRPLFWYLPFYELRWGATPAAIIRVGDWKLIHFFGDYFDDQRYYRVGQRSELYNLREDIGETRDLAKAEPERVANLREQLFAWLKSIPAEVPGDNPHHDPTRELLETKQKQPWNP